MARKMLTDSDIWTTQYWFKKLPVMYKVAFFYIKDQCDEAGVWGINCNQLIDDTGLKQFDITDFVNNCNTDYDGVTGQKLFKERLRIIGNRYLWITGYVQFQKEGKDGLVSPNKVTVPNSINVLKKYGLLDEAISNGFLRLKTEQLPDGAQREPRGIPEAEEEKDKGNGKVKELDMGVQGEKVLTPSLELRDALCDYFSIKKTSTSKLYNSVCDFIMAIKHKNELQIAALALQKYMAYKARSKEQTHSIKTWIGTRDNDYRDGQWIMIDWELKLKNSNTHAPIERTTTAASAVIQPGKRFR